MANGLHICVNKFAIRFIDSDRKKNSSYVHWMDLVHYFYTFFKPSWPITAQFQRIMNRIFESHFNESAPRPTALVIGLKDLYMFFGK